MTGFPQDEGRPVLKPDPGSRQEPAFPPLSVPIPPTVFPAMERGKAWLRERAPDPTGFR